MISAYEPGSSSAPLPSAARPASSVTVMIGRPLVNRALVSVLAGFCRRCYGGLVVSPPTGSVLEGCSVSSGSVGVVSGLVDIASPCGFGSRCSRSLSESDFRIWICGLHGLWCCCRIDRGRLDPRLGQHRLELRLKQYRSRII